MHRETAQPQKQGRELPDPYSPLCVGLRATQGNTALFPASLHPSKHCNVLSVCRPPPPTHLATTLRRGSVSSTSPRGDPAAWSRHRAGALPPLMPQPRAFASSRWLGLGYPTHRFGCHVGSRQGAHPAGEVEEVSQAAAEGCPQVRRHRGAGRWREAAAAATHLWETRERVTGGTMAGEERKRRKRRMQRVREG